MNEGAVNAHMVGGRREMDAWNREYPVCVFFAHEKSEPCATCLAMDIVVA